MKNNSGHVAASVETSTDPRLLPCPFCGGDAALDWAPKDQPFVTCKKSCAFTPWFCIGDEEKAIASWNSRAPVDAKHAVIMEEQESLRNPATQVFFRAGLIACREYMARFVESQSPTIAASIRANWWPSLGQDFGAPRQMEWGELTEGEYGTESFRVKDDSEVSPTIEALPIALHFLESLK